MADETLAVAFINIADRVSIAMVSFDRERARILNEMEMTCRVANQMRLLLAKDTLEPEARARAQQVLDRQIPELKKLTSMLSQLDELDRREAHRARFGGSTETGL